MPQNQDRILPFFLNLDSDYSKLKPDETPFAKNINWDINANPESGIGTNNPSGEGQNMWVLTPTRSNEVHPNISMPNGINKNIGSFESVTTQELYYFNWNSNGNHGIYVINGNSGVWNKVIIDPELQFTDNQEAFIADHRVKLRLVLDKYGNIQEKFLMITDGNSWQKWVNVRTAIATDGFNVSLYPYFTLRPPHYDRRELVEWATRPIMYNPIAETIPNTEADQDKTNRLIDQVFQFAVSVNYTDGRWTRLSPYSEPIFVKSEDFLNNPQNLPKNILLTIYAGSCMVESMDIYVRTTPKQTAGVPNQLRWSDWKKYDRIYKFGNDPNVLGTDYWLRTNQWSNYNFDSEFNTIQYVFDNSKLAEIVSPEDTLSLQNDLPQLSWGHTTLADTQALGNNRYFYDNFNSQQLSQFEITVQEKEQTGCDIPNRKMYLYAYIGMPDGVVLYTSQVGYYLGEDTQMRFGGLRPRGVGNPLGADIRPEESKFYNLDFADRNSFRCYLKGTPYFSDGEWYIVNSDDSIRPVGDLLNFSSQDVLQFVQSVFDANGYFMCRFEFNVPAGRYIACLGRHNVPNNGNYRGESTYVMGIANSRQKQTFSPFTCVTPDALVSFSKEMEVDCTAADIDVWGNNADMFYVFCPFKRAELPSKFIEGYFYESPSTLIPVEMFPYRGTATITAGGTFTDKNGFYFLGRWGNNSNIVASLNTEFVAKVNCAYPTNFIIPTSEAGLGWKQNTPAFLSNNNNGVVGDCNRILYDIRITSLDGSIGYSNIAISIKDGGTVYTDQDGNATLVIHNGMPTPRQSNVYINSGGNFRISIANCGYVPLFNFNEPDCVLDYNGDCTVRRFLPNLLLGVNAEGSSETSLKENSAYSIGGYCADLAGRLQFVNVIANTSVSSFLARGNTRATYFRLLINGSLNIDPDLKWFAPCVSNQLNVLKYIQWVGDKIRYIDSSGNVVSDPSSAVFCAIYIDSLFNYNVANRFSLLANYQFSPEDRVRILDNGDGQLFDVATYGDPIDLQIYGTNYNQAAINAQIIPNNQENPVVNVNVETQTLAESITLFVRYDKRLDKLVENTGFWVELYTPTQLQENVAFNELKWYPVVNGEISEFTGITNGQPTYNYPNQIDLNFWDTYLFSRNISIPDVGTKFFNHLFESPNIADTWGARVNSGGRQWVKNDNAKQQWFPADVIKSDSLLGNGLLNGLGIFRSNTRKDFGQYPFGGIMGMNTQRSVVFFICQNDYFSTSFDFHFAYPNEQGIMVTNLDSGLSQPFQKIGDNYGMSAEDTGTLIFDDRFAYWYDRKNTAYIKCDYKNAVDISQTSEESGERGGIQSYLNAKTEFITKWNNLHDKQDRFDVVSGIDQERGFLYLTFRPRRGNSNNSTSYTNKRRNIALDHQETFVYSIQYNGWIPCVGYTPEGYGRLRGNDANVEFYSFAAGKPYKQNNTPNNNFCTFFGIKTDPIMCGIISGGDPASKEVPKIFQNFGIESNPNAWNVDMIYTDFINSFSWMSQNQFTRKEQIYYGSILRNANAYPPVSSDELYKSMLFDGYRMMGMYMFFRLVGNKLTADQYNELKNIYSLYTYSPIKKK